MNFRGHATAIRAAVVVTGVYGYFLIFAQFAFVELLRAHGTDMSGQKAVLGAMAGAGIAGGFLTAWQGAGPWLVRGSLLMAALASAIAPWSHSLPAAAGVAILTGAALGGATVGLAMLVPAWCGVAWLGLGTGLAYAACNLPVVFQQTPAGQAWIASAFALLAAVSVPPATEWEKVAAAPVLPAWGALALFTALVWLDSAAFFIIQHAEDLKSATWREALLWRHAAVHLATGILAGLWLSRGGAKTLPAVAWGMLAAAALAVNFHAGRGLAGWLYPAAASFYSTALIAWPGWFSGARGPRDSGWRAAWLFAVAGWFGSANGIAMVQSMHRVPVAFVAISGMVVIAVMLTAGRGKGGR